MKLSRSEKALLRAIFNNYGNMYPENKRNIVQLWKKITSTEKTTSRFSGVTFK